ncbi:hypothetical protein CWI38_0234p0050 [Hamiltosporidium tvaerminnensis]|uniref:Uncharacterized protein n=1 Tax=Hamiltosporidium tvaerminnensis TaxID=1176355 RepID=A0A4Q9LZ75_9MICR|nr:hypothetical protein CWI38_0234p0050 [Hamiltosporidium tvaerminnensis]
MLNIHKKNTTNLLSALQYRLTSPIILYGPPGTGKTHILYKTLHSLKITPLYFPNPSTYTNTLLFTNTIAHTDIDTLEDFNKFLKNNTHPLNIVIETRNLYFLSKCVKGSILVKFLYTTNTLLSKYNLVTPNLHSLSIFEEVSRRGVSEQVCDIKGVNRRVSKRGVSKRCSKRGVSKRSSNNTPLNISNINNTPLNTGNVNNTPLNTGNVNNTPLNILPINNTPLNILPINNTPLNILSCYNTSLSFYHFLGKIFYYDRDRDRDRDRDSDKLKDKDKNKKKENKKFENKKEDKKDEKKDEKDNKEQNPDIIDNPSDNKALQILNNISFFKNKIKDYLFENYLYFTDIREQGVIIDNLSLFDCYSEGVLCNVICVMGIEKLKPKCFYSFKSPYYLKGRGRGGYLKGVNYWYTYVKGVSL